MIYPFQAIALSGWMNRERQAVIDYLIEENRILKARLTGRLLRFTDEQRVRPARKTNALGRRLPYELETLATPDTLRDWRRKLIAHKWTFAKKTPGRLRVTQEITNWILRRARENSSWGCDRIQGALELSAAVLLKQPSRV